MKATLNQNILVRMVNTAMDCGKQMFINYKDAKGQESTRFVEPVKWMNNPTGLGILTKCHDRDGQYRHFKIDNIERIVITDYDAQFTEGYTV